MASLDAMRVDNGGKLPSFAWPGAYPLIYITGDGLTVCADCADADTSDPAIAADVYWEGPAIRCDDCNWEIESAYGDPDAEEEGAMRDEGGAMNINGCELLAALPIYAGRDQPDHFIVVLRRVRGHYPAEYVSGLVRTLADEEWSAGHYYDNPASAVSDAYVRANIHGIPEEEIRAQARRGAVSR